MLNVSWKKCPREIRAGLLLLVISALLFAGSPDRVRRAFVENAALAGRIMILTMIAVFVSLLIHLFLPPDYAQRHLSGTRKRHLFYAAILGILTPGPVYSIYPILFTLRKKGVGYATLVAYISGQTLMGPARIPLELGLFGTRFFLYRVVLAMVMAPLAGYLFLLFSRVFPDRESAGNF